MNKVVALSTLVLLATIGLSAYAYTVYLPSLTNVGAPGSGTLNIYLADPPPSSPSLKYLVVNVTSVTLKYSSNLTESPAVTTSTNTNTTLTSTIASGENESAFVNRYTYNVSSSIGTNVNITSLQGSGLLLGSPKVPAGNVTGIILNISGARAYWTNGNSTQLKVVADGKLMINTQFSVQSGGSTDLTISISPGDIHVSPGQASVLRPVILVHAVSTGTGGTSTSTSETETGTNSSTSSSSTSTSSSSST